MDFHHGFRDFEISLLAAAWIVPAVVAQHRRHRLNIAGAARGTGLPCFHPAARSSITHNYRSARPASRKRDPD